MLALSLSQHLQQALLLPAYLLAYSALLLQPHLERAASAAHALALSPSWHLWQELVPMHQLPLALGCQYWRPRLQRTPRRR